MAPQSALSAATLTPDQFNAIAARLQPGDVLLYKPSGLFGRLIRFHTGSPDVAHVEVSLGWHTAVASRDGQGVNLYPLRLDGLTHVLRPTRSYPFNLESARMWYDHVGKGQPYGWLDLLQFCGYAVNGPGMVCSTLATYILRAGEIPIFGQVPAERITPVSFLLSDALSDVTGEILSGRVGTVVQLVPAGAPVPSITTPAVA